MSEKPAPLPEVLDPSSASRSALGAAARSPAARLFEIGAWTIVGTAALGFFAAWAARSLDLVARAPRRLNIFFYLYYAYEAPHFAALALFGLAALVWVRLRRPAPVAPLDAPRSRRFWLAAAALALAVIAAAGLVERFALRDYPFSMDEYAASFQSRIFARGQLTARVPEAWRPFAHALTPIFILIDRRSGEWSQSYFPVYAAVRSLFIKMSAERWANPVLGGLTLLALAAVGRSLWPGNPRSVAAGLLLLAVSPQFLLTSATAYSMPAHLLFNLLWLLLWLRKDRIGWIAAPWLGVLATGLHNPFPHLLFAAPFLMSAVLQRKWKLVAYCAAVYGGGLFLWWSWLAGLHPLFRGSGPLSQFSFPVGATEWLTQLMHATLVFSWLTPAAALLFVVGVASWRTLPPVARELTLGVFLTFGFYVLYPLGQGHGWGYRYLYGALGNVVIVAVFGLETLTRAAVVSRRAVVGASVAVSCLFSLPLRAREAHDVVAPFVRASDYIATMKGRIVTVDVDTGWYVQDLVRNDPFLENDPKIMFDDRARPKLQQIERAFPGRLRRLSSAELAALGFPGARTAVSGLR